MTVLFCEETRNVSETRNLILPFIMLLQIISRTALNNVSTKLVGMR